jgi:hypothetical protein
MNLERKRFGEWEGEPTDRSFSASPIYKRQDVIGRVKLEWVRSSIRILIIDLSPLLASGFGLAVKSESRLQERALREEKPSWPIFLIAAVIFLTASMRGT